MLAEGSRGGPHCILHFGSSSSFVSPFAIFMNRSHLTTLKQRGVIMILTYAHVRMSPRAKTSAPDQWSENKGMKKEWIWVTENADWDCWMASYIGVVRVSGLTCSGG